MRWSAVASLATVGCAPAPTSQAPAPAPDIWIPCDVDPSVTVRPPHGSDDSDVLLVRIVAAPDDPWSNFYYWAESATSETFVVVSVGFGRYVDMILRVDDTVEPTRIYNLRFVSTGPTPFEFEALATPSSEQFDVESCTHESSVRVLAHRDVTDPLVGLGPLPATMSFTLEGYPWTLELEGITDPTTPPEGESETRVAEVSVPILFEVYEEE